MLEKPAIPDQLIASQLNEEYGLKAAQIAFLPLGADVNTAVYRVGTEQGVEYFLKLRKGAFDEMTVVVPQMLRAQGVQAVIAPLETCKGQRWGSLEEYKMILYPFVEGRDGYQVTLTASQWSQMGAEVRKVHAVKAPEEIEPFIQKEDYSAQWREEVKAFQTQVEKIAFDELVAARLAAFMKAKQEVIATMLNRADELAQALQRRELEFVLCHSDLHPGNLLIDASGRLYIVDWDNPIFAPKEKDLMFAGIGRSSIMPGGWEEASFYQGYGRTEVDGMALAYYRYERIIVDMAEFCKQLFWSDEGGEDREQAYRWLSGQFAPEREVEAALRTDEEYTKMEGRKK